MGKIFDEVSEFLEDQANKAGGPNHLERMGDLLNRFEIVDKNDFYEAIHALVPGSIMMIALKQDVERGMQINLTVALLIGAHLRSKGLI